MTEPRTSADALILLGVNHTTAPLEVRERLAIPPAQLAEATRLLAAQPGVREAMILSTCNRVEMLTVADPATALTEQPTNSQIAEEALSFLHRFLSVQPTAVRPHLYAFREQDAIRHLFRVASSLDSMVIGEAQILGQVKHSWTVAREVGAVKGTLDPLLQRAFSVAKRVRTETQIGSSTVSVASVAAELARKIFGSLRGKTILMVGAGKMSELAARHLIQQGAATLLVSNRTEARAEAMASTLRTPAITTGVIPFDQLHAESHRADIILTSTGAGQIFTPEHGRALQHRRRNRPVFFIDIAVPRDVAPEVNQVDGCFVYDMDDLQAVAARNQASRSREAEAAESIVTLEVERWSQRAARAGRADLIRQITAEAETLRQAEVARLLARLGPLHAVSEDQRAAIDSMTRSLTAKLLHPRLVAAREDAARDEAARDAE